MSHFTKRVILLVFLGCLILSLTSSEMEEIGPYKSSWFDKLPKLETGDIVFRRVDGPTSHFIDLVDDQANYSHVGIVFVTNTGGELVINVIPGEGSLGVVQAESFAMFLEPALSFAIFRMHREAGVDRVIAADWANSLVDKIPFDLKFDLETDDELYCTELVWKAYLAAGIDLVSGSFDEMKFPFLDSNQYILPSSLMSSDYLYQLYPTRVNE